MDKINELVTRYCEGMITETELKRNLILTLVEVSEQDIKTLALYLHSMIDK